MTLIQGIFQIKVLKKPHSYKHADGIKSITMSPMNKEFNIKPTKIFSVANSAMESSRQRNSKMCK